MSEHPPGTFHGDEFSALYPVPLRICVAPGARSAISEIRSHEVLRQAQIVHFQGKEQPDGPTIVVVTPEDMTGPMRASLLAFGELSRPGRPVLLGGTRHRDLLLDAINVWKVVRIVEAEMAAALLPDALTKAYEVVQLECGLVSASAGLKRESDDLERALAELEETQSRLRHSERLFALGHITSSLIPVMAGHLGSLQEFSVMVDAWGPRRNPRLEELLGFAMIGIRSLDAMLEEISGYAESRSEEIRLEPQDLDSVVHFAVSFSRFDPLASQRVLEVDLQSAARVRGDCFRLYQVLLNLLRNAFQATPAQGRINVSTAIAGEDAIITVQNDGEPVSPQLLSHFFEPFFTTKGDEGMGLGLSLCKQTVERHGGTIRCQSGPGPVTTFRITLPLMPPG